MQVDFKLLKVNRQKEMKKPKPAIFNLGYAYPLGYSSSLPGVRGNINHIKISPTKGNKRGFGGMQRGLNLNWKYTSNKSLRTLD